MKIIRNTKEWNELRANPVRWAAYLRGLEKRRKQMDSAFLRKWKAIGSPVVDGKPACSVEANYSLPELALIVPVPKTHWLNLLKRGVLKSLRVSEVHAYLDSTRVPAKRAA